MELAREPGYPRGDGSYPPLASVLPAPAGWVAACTARSLAIETRSGVDRDCRELGMPEHLGAVTVVRLLAATFCPSQPLAPRSMAVQLSTESRSITESWVGSPA